jgi:hypothetical protein
MPATLKDLERGDAQAIEEFAQFMRWAGPVDYPLPTRNLANAWYEGHLTLEEGRRLENDQKLAHFLKQ